MIIMIISIFLIIFLHRISLRQCIERLINKSNNEEFTKFLCEIGEV